MWLSGAIQNRIDLERYLRHIQSLGGDGCNVNKRNCSVSVHENGLTEEYWDRGHKTILERSDQRLCEPDSIDSHSNEIQKYI